MDKKLPPLDVPVTPNSRFNEDYFTSLSLITSAPGPSWRAGTPNHLGARVPLLHTDLNIELWRKHLIGYEDIEICQFLEFGFPVGLSAEPPAKLVSATRNHGSAYSYFPWIDKFLMSSITRKYIAGPYATQPFSEIHISPMMTAPKRPNDRRPVFDATFGVPSQPTSPAFTYSPGSFINYDQFTRKLKTLLTKAGYNADLYSGHSFRRGGASFLHACGGSALQVQAAGDWSSGCFTRYLFLSTEARLQAQLLMARNINSLCPSS